MPRPRIEFNEAKHRYLVEGEEFPSVTTIINATVPKNLSWWGMTVACDGVARLLDDGAIPDGSSGAEIVELLKQHKLTVNHALKRAGDRGTAIHKALEEWGRDETVPNPLDFNEEDRERITGLAKWLLDNRPAFIEQEVRTASLEHRYVGTLDARVFFEAGEQNGKHALIDAKTSKAVYPDSHFPQLEAYERAEVESGMPATDLRGVLHIPASGAVNLVISRDAFEDFELLLRRYYRARDRKNRKVAA